MSGYDNTGSGNGSVDGSGFDAITWDSRGVAHAYDEGGQSHAVGSTGWEAAFLDALRVTGIVKEACRRAGITYKQAYHRRDTDGEFAMEWRMALDEAIESLEEAAWTRARDGVKQSKPVYSGGKYVGEQEITIYSDQLLMFLLKAHKPQMYRELPPASATFNLNLVKQAARRMAIEQGFTPEEVEEAERAAIQLYSPQQALALPPTLPGQTAVIEGTPAPKRRGRPKKQAVSE